jgi:hypothetical protein
MPEFEEDFYHYESDPFEYVDTDEPDLDGDFDEADFGPYGYDDADRYYAGH